MKLITVEKNRGFGVYGTPLLAAFAAIALASQCGAATATSVVSNTTSTSPGGMIFDGTRNWVSDQVLGFCRMDPAGGAGGFRLTNCVNMTTNTPGVTAIPGQAAYDPATRFLYLPDQSTASKGIWRYSFNGTFSTPVNIATTAGLGAQRPGAIALGTDGSLIVSMTANANIVQVTTPASATQTVNSLGITSSGKPANGMAMVGTQLWIADLKGVTVNVNPTACVAPCTNALLSTLRIAGPITAIAFDSVNSFAYIGTAGGVFRNSLITGLTDLYSRSYTKAGVPGLFSNITGLGTDAAGNLLIIDDPSAGQINGAATVFTVPANSLPDGVGTVPSPLPTVPPAVFTTAIANPATLFSNGLATPTGAVFMATPAGGHIWVADTAKGFCKLVSTLPAPSLTACATLPVGFVPGSPAYDSTGKFAYLPDTTAAGAGILRFAFNATTETLGVPTTIATNAALVLAAADAATAPTALALGPDGQLYTAMAGSTEILRITGPATATHTITIIGNVVQTGSPSLAFFNADLYDAEVSNASILFNATLCKGTCNSLFLAVTLNDVTALYADASFVYIGDAGQLWRYDPVAATLTLMADTGLVNGTPRPFGSITGVAKDNLGNIFAIDQSGPVWSFATAASTLTSLSPASAPESSVLTVTLTGTGFPASLVVNTCPAITPGNVVVVSATQITSTFSINPLGPVGLCAVTVSTAAGTSAAVNFNVLIGPPALTSITPASGNRGRTIPLSIAGGNMALGVLTPMAGITFSGTVITSTLITTNLIIDPTAAVGPRNVIVTTPTGTSNALIFNVTAATPVLTSITPSQGTAATTVPVVIAGTDLFQASLILPPGFTLSGTPVFTNTSIAATLVIASTVPAGPQNITVTTPGGPSNAVAFKILPALTSIAPVQAKAGTATAITLTGTSLAAVTSINAGANITVTGLVATLNQITATFTTLVTAPLGAQSITVTDPNGISNSVTFTITASTPVLTSIAPVTGARGATVAVTLTGTGLTGGTINLPTGITLSGTPVITFTTITANLVIAVDAPLGAQSITVTTPGGISLPVTFTVTAPVPTLASITPAQGVANTTVAVTLTGTGLFGATFNLPTGFTLSGVPVVNAAATSITANFVIAPTVPAGLQSITVTTPGGTSNAVTFNILPALTSIAPVQARAGAATAVTLTGTSLLGVTSINAGVNITVTNLVVVSATQITATFTSAPAAPVGPVSVTVTGPSGTSAPVTFTLIGPVPVIASIVPATGARGATVAVTLTGTGLTLGTLNLPVGITVSGTPVVTFTTITANLVIAVDAPLGAQSITVTTPGTGNTSLPVTFTVTAPVPTLASITPAQGVANTTVAVTLTGTGLFGATFNLPTGFTLSGVPVVNAAATSITANFVIASTVPAGLQSITVTTPGGTSSAVTFNILPVLTSITPVQARAGASTVVTLAGTSLSGVTSVNAGANITVTNIVATVNQITATFTSAPAAPVGPVSVTVTVAGSISNAVTYTLTGPIPVIASISPATGGTGATVPITITGTGLTLGTLNLPTGITVTGTPVVSFTQITATLLIAGNAPVGATSISVTTPGTGNTSNAFPFTVFALAPTLTSVSPTTATAGTTVTVTLTGTGLTGTTSVNTNPGVSGITVSGFTVNSATQISATLVIAASAASTPISVTNVNGTSNSVTFGIVPTLASISPATGVAGTSVPVILTGTSFTGATSINVAGVTGVTVTNLVVVGSTQITATLVIATAATQGVGSITVSTPGGITNAVPFTVLAPAPVLTSLNTTTISKRSQNVGMNVNGTNLGNLPVSSIHILLNGVPIDPATVNITNFAPSQTQIRFNWTFLAAAPISSGYSITVTTPSGTSNPLTFTVTN